MFLVFFLTTVAVLPENANAVIKLARFMHMTMDYATPNLRKFTAVPGLENLTVRVWDIDPVPIYMLENSHMYRYDHGTERKIIDLQRLVLATCFSPRDGIVVDMGINDGYISALAAAYQYSVVGVDGQPECVRRFLFAKAINNFRRVNVYNNIVCNVTMTMNIPNGVCGGGSRYLLNNNARLQLDRKKGSFSHVPGFSVVKSRTFDELVGNNNVVFFHLDVEGAELSVLESASRALGDRRIQNLVWEFAPHRWSANRAPSMRRTVALMRNFTCRNVKTLDALHPFASLPVIDNWETMYARTEHNHAILDIWCTLQTECNTAARV